MNRTFNDFIGVGEGYQPIMNCNNSNSTKRPEPPKGGSGVPNLPRNNNHVKFVTTTKKTK